MKNALSLLAGCLLLQACCTKEDCTVETEVFEITFHNFKAGELDAIQVFTYTKSDTAFQMPTDSFKVQPENRPVGEEVAIPLSRSINLANNYLVQVQRINQVYKITGLELTERSCNVGGCLRPSTSSYQSFGHYFVNGNEQRNDKLRIYR